MAETKTKIILDYLKGGGKITDMKAVELCQNYRLSGTIFILRQRGLNIQDRWIENENTGTRYKEYWLVDEV